MSGGREGENRERRGDFPLRASDTEQPGGEEAWSSGHNQGDWDTPAQGTFLPPPALSCPQEGFGEVHRCELPKLMAGRSWLGPKPVICVHATRGTPCTNLVDDGQVSG